MYFHLCFDIAAVVSRDFSCVATFPLWFRTYSGLLWPLQSGRAVTAHAGGFRVRILLRFDAAVVVSHKFFCVAFQGTRRGFARIPSLSGFFWGGRLGCGPPRRARWVGREQCGFARISAVSREFPCVSTLPVWFRANCLAFRRSRYDFA